MSNLRNLKKDVLFLAHDLSTLITVKVLIEGVEADKFNDLIAKVSAFQSSNIAQINAPAISAPKKADRKASAEQALAVKKAYAKAVKQFYKELSQKMLNDYAELADSIANVK